MKTTCCAFGAKVRDGFAVPENSHYNPAGRKQPHMDDQHKAKLAQGRNDARAVKNYLEFLENNKPKRGRKRTPDTIQKRLDKIEAELDDAGTLQRLAMLQEQEDLAAELEKMGEVVDGSELRAAFVEAAARYGKSKGISRGTFRKMGVDAKTLTEAGV